MLDRPSRIFGRADEVRVPQYSTLLFLLTVIGHVQHLFLHLLPIPMEGVPSPIVFDGLVLYRCLAVASTPCDIVSSDIKPKNPAESCDVSRPYTVPLSQLLCLESEAHRNIPYARKPAGQICSPADLAYGSGRSMIRPAGKQTSQTIVMSRYLHTFRSVCSHEIYSGLLRSPDVEASSEEFYKVRRHHNPLNSLLGVVHHYQRRFREQGRQQGS